MNDTLVNVVQSYDRLKKFNGRVFASGNDFQNGVSNGLIAQVGDSLTDEEKTLFNQVDSVYIFDVLDFLINKKGEHYYFGTGAFRPPNFFTSPFQMVKVDSNQQFIKRGFISYPPLAKDIDSLRFFGSINSFWLSDSTFLLTANGPTTSDNKSDIHLFVYDTSFNRLNYKRIISDDSSEYSVFPKTAVFDSICECFYMGSTKIFNSFLAGAFSTRDTTDFRLVKFDRNLNVLFNRYYRRDKTMQFWTLKTDFKGNVIMAGEIQETNTPDITDTDIFILKVDSLGNLNSPVGLPESETEINRLNFRFFPNPSKGLVNFRQYNVMEDYRMDLYDSQGHLLQQYRLQNSDNSIDLSDYPKGVYLYRLTDSKGRRTSGKLVRE